jgi:hypothetical protein
MQEPHHDESAAAPEGPVSIASRCGSAPWRGLWFAANAVIVAVAIVVQLTVTADHEGGFFTGTAAVLNVFVYFTIQSNIAVGLSSFLLAAGWANRSTAFRTVRMIGVAGITITFIVFHAVLRDLQDLTDQAAFADFLLHTLSPIVCVAGWLIFGPRRSMSKRVVMWMLAYLAAWGTFTMIRGAIVRHDGVHFYPFMDPTENGYLRVAVYLAIIAVVYVGAAVGALVSTVSSNAGQHLLRLLPLSPRVPGRHPTCSRRRCQGSS